MKGLLGWWLSLGFPCVGVLAGSDSMRGRELQRQEAWVFRSLRICWDKLLSLFGKSLCFLLVKVGLVTPTSWSFSEAQMG